MSVPTPPPERPRPRTRVAVISGVMTADNARVALFVEALIEDGFEVVMIQPAYRDDPVIPAGARYHRLDAPTDYFWPRSSPGGLLRALFDRFDNLWRIAAILRQERPAIYHAIEPDVWLLAIVMRWRYGGKVVADVREVYSDRATAFPGLFRGVFQWSVSRLLRALVRHTDRVIHVSAPRHAHYGFPEDKCVVIPHFARRVKTPADPERPPELRDKEIVLHAGALRVNYAAANILRAMEMVHARRPQAVLVVLGGKAGRATAYQQTLERLETLGAVRLLPPLPHAEVIRWMRWSDAGLNLVLPVDATHRLASPQKLYEYVSVGLPVVGADLPEIREVLAGHDCGVLVDPEVPEAIAAGIERILADPAERLRLRENARRAHLEALNWEKIRGQFLDIYRRLV
jgi:glycosyltransferase involved in cell wall biosynthesis